MALLSSRSCAAATLASGRVSPAAARTARRPARPRCAKHTWPKGTYVIPEYAFAADLTGLDVTLSKEHTAVRWLDARAAQAALRFDSNRTALEELAERLEADDLADPVE